MINFFDKVSHEICMLCDLYKKCAFIICISNSSCINFPRNYNISRNNEFDYENKIEIRTKIHDSSKS